MRIAVVSTPHVPAPPPKYGGTELIVGILVEGLVARGHQVTLYATGDSTGVADLRWRYPRAVWPPDPYRELNHAAFAVHDILASSVRFDVIHAHVASLLPFAQLIDVPVVYTLHHERDASLDELYRDVVSSVTFVAISERQRELAELPGTSVVHHGLDPRRYRLGSGRGGYAAFLGRFAREKGVHIALEAAHIAGIPIRLAGTPHWKDADYFSTEVEPRLRRPGVTWLGEASHEPKVQLLCGAAATLVPIDWEEPFGLVMAESMLCGTPVLAFGRGSAPELIEPGLTGFVVRDREEMAWRLGRLARGVDHFDRRACRDRARERFSMQRMVDDYLAIYREVAHAGERAGASGGVVSLT